ncbi:MAG TPA: hypothetical protein PKN96_12265 [Flavobacterium sp.]|uniref:hypothetical protein n=1 Tax=Flavobacterium sp. TaxID=239 RepID=UPI002BF2307F|nr:hypothetical protein [Flavobacterium sp.]HNP34058.1 hypothetical protein [Flavobacterium sp.]
MKKYILILGITTFLVSCSSENIRPSETSEFLGKWKLTEVLIDPGDGSGTYQPVTGNRIIEFLTNGNISSNYSLCPFYTGTATQFTTPYYADQNYILPKACFGEGSNIGYQRDNDNLILSYPCYEGCLYKFIRTE